MAVALKVRGAMEFTSQAVIFLIILLVGALLGIVFDFYRVLRGIIKPRSLVTSLTDLIYWLVATIIVFAVLLVCNWGELRFYIFMGLVAGVAMYYRLLSPYIITLLQAAIRGAGMVVYWIQQAIHYGVLLPLSYLLKIIGWPVSVAKRPARYMAGKAVAWYRMIWPKPPNEHS
jgi:spore cortex biosynthesis protein YabQ